MRRVVVTRCLLTAMAIGGWLSLAGPTSWADGGTAASATIDQFLGVVPACTVVDQWGDSGLPVTGAANLTDGDDSTAVTFSPSAGYGYTDANPAVLRCDIDLERPVRLATFRLVVGKYLASASPLDRPSNDCRHVGDTSYKVEGSTDGITWTPLASGGTASQPVAVVTSEFDGRYYRLSVTACQGPAGVTALSGYVPSSLGPYDGKPVSPDTALPDAMNALQLAQQDLVHNAGEALDDAGMALGASSGFAGVSLDMETSTVRLYWKGPVPASVLNQIAQLSTLVPGVPGLLSPPKIIVLPAKYDFAEMDLVLDALTKSPTAAAWGLQGDNPKADGSGIKIAVEGNTHSLADWSALAGIDVVAVSNETVMPSVGRWDDVPPYWGGSVIQQKSTGGRCTLGFGAHYPHGDTVGITAAHCASSFSETREFVTNKGRKVGWSQDINVARDLMNLDPGANTDSSFGSYIWIGGPDTSGGGANESWYRVTGVANAVEGDWVITSGAYSGTRGNILVKDIHVRRKDNRGIWIEELALSEQKDHLSVIGEGDSGGPTFRAAGSGIVVAEGTIYGYDANTVVPCKGVPTSSTRHCAWRIYFTGRLKDYLNAEGLAINV
jgi:streptogrisin D